MATAATTTTASNAAAADRLAVSSLTTTGTPSAATAPARREPPVQQDHWTDRVIDAISLFGKAIGGASTSEGRKLGKEPTAAHERTGGKRSTG